MNGLPTRGLLRNTFQLSTARALLCLGTLKGGEKSGSCDIPTIFPLLQHPKARKEPELHEAIPPPPKRMRKEAFEKPKPLADALVKDIISSLCQVISKLDSEKASLTLKLDELKFSLQQFAGSDEDIRFYTGFPNYSTLIIFYEFLLPAASQLNY